MIGKETTMKIPKYVQELLKRSQYVYDSYQKDPNYAVGYTIRIGKRSPYTRAKSFKEEIERFRYWAERVFKNQYNGTSDIFYILYMPSRTHYSNIGQFAVVTIYDPVMKDIEQFIPKEDKKGSRR